MINKNYCMSSYMALRYIADDNYDFFEHTRHKIFKPIDDTQKILVDSADEIDEAISSQFEDLRKNYKKLGVMLSGGMDSAIVASYMPGCEAYTFRFLNGEFESDELKRAEHYAEIYNLKLNYVDINWDVIDKNLDEIMKLKGAPVHSIETQIYQAAIKAKDDGVDLMLIGDGADYIFGGMDKLLSRDWSFDEFYSRYVFLEPCEVLNENFIFDMHYLFERYRQPDNQINFLKFLDDIFALESFSSYSNAFNAAKLNYYDPYAKLKMRSKLDLNRIRRGESKYLIRALFAKKYPDIKIPNKNPMPRPVDYYFRDWSGPVRPEFKNNLDMQKFSGNQKWQLYCLERFLNKFEN